MTVACSTAMTTAYALLKADHKVDKLLRADWSHGVGEDFSVQVSGGRYGLRVNIHHFVDQNRAAVKLIEGDGTTDKFACYSLTELTSPTALELVAKGEEVIANARTLLSIRSPRSK